MNRIVRIVVLYLLVLALPVQGWAAATQTACAPAMHQPGMQMMHHDTTAAFEQTHDHHQMHATHDVADAATIKHAPADKTGTHGNATCSVCAACYIGMALLPAMPDLAKPVEHASAAVATPSSFFLGYIPDGIKRPPRHLLV
ncbi:hypothetical protein [Oxalicibacterium faecigallinarum]|uniref:DUF2946 domain-containing protein n=1 Tax=Oxalicibacterium faecigallinarum TaxID=573741 RepID=A0A8J3EZD3_9BURK|nr:hypothetical protein [Oxalicibacterium faecigallinarum]GGI16865.1 hypothetical protein GCM10008066_06100 [Oxalicibacterium faecigallinarum]